ncbi:MAG: ABC transporter permease [Nitriliruptorales bacterium]|nr:ABC transporter permease [Nitriliruptorales bacterium]
MRRQRLDLLLELTRHEVTVSYKGSVLGLAWSQAAVAMQFFVLTVLFTRVVDLGIEHYPAFLLIGLVAWQLFSTGMTAGTQSLVQGRDLFRTPRIPAWLLPSAAVGAALTRFVLAVPLLVVVLAITVGMPTMHVVAIPLVLAVQLLVIAGPAVLLGAAHVRYRDVGHLVGVVLVPLFYLTPVFYPPERVPDGLSVLVTINPMAHVITAYRDILIAGQWPDAGLGVVALVHAAILVAALFMLERARTSLVDLL